MADDQRAFALKDSVEDFVDAGVAVPPDGRSLSVGELLTEGKGAIITDDSAEADALAALDVLKEVSLKEATAIQTAHKKTAKSGGKE